MNLHRAVGACEYCIDGMVPGVVSHAELGPVFQRCPFCIALGVLGACCDCDDTAVFPADFQCLHCLVLDLTQRDLAPAICPGCTGVTYLISLVDGPEF